ncbi:MAG: hypothetical protein ABEJ05_08550 [Haloglomus sp.]
MLPGDLTWEGLFWAALFSLPTGVGVALAAGRSLNAPPTVPLALAMSGVTALVLFVVVAGAQVRNPSEDAPADDPTPEESVPDADAGEPRS